MPGHLIGRKSSIVREKTRPNRLIYEYQVTEESQEVALIAKRD